MRKKPILSNLSKYLFFVLFTVIDFCTFFSQLDVNKILKLLKLYSASNQDLISTYFSERFKHQLEQQHPNGDSTSVYPIGSITVRAMVHETHLRVEILNARHLKPLETQRVQTSVVPSKDSTNQGQEKRSTTSRHLTACLSSPDYDVISKAAKGQNSEAKNSDNLINEVSIIIPKINLICMWLILIFTYIFLCAVRLEKYGTNSG